MMWSLQLLFEQQCLYLHDSADLLHTSLLNRCQGSLELSALVNVIFLAAKVVDCNAFAVVSVKQRKLHCVATCPDDLQQKDQR